MTEVPGAGSPIETLVVDDDFRVARVHAAAVDRVDGFTCTGVAHTAAEARVLIAERRPQFMLLDIYLPDEDGLSLLRSLQRDGDPVPDVLVITAAQDVETVRSAIRAGVVYYLIKPFGFAQLREQLEAYRRLHQQLDATIHADQATIDQLFRTLRSAPPARPGRQLPPTMRSVLGCVRESSQPVSAVDVATLLGISRPTAQRYLSELERRRVIELVLEYGSPGRPGHLYRPIPEGRGTPAP
jgi:response regulator of citrate/malate metabolism